MSVKKIGGVALFLALCGAVCAQSGWAAGQEGGKSEPSPALVKVRYYAVKGEEFAVRDAAGIRAVMGWLAKAESGPVSEHAKIGACDRDAEMYLYQDAGADKPSRTIELYTSCHHVSGRVVTAEQFAELRKILTEAGKK